MPTPRDTFARLPRDERTFSDTDLLAMLDLLANIVATALIAFALYALVQHCTQRRDPPG